TFYQRGTTYAARAWLSAQSGKDAAAQGDYESAIRYFKKAMELAGPEGAWPWFYLDRANCYVWLKQPEKAMADFAKAIELWPTHWQVWMWRGDFHTKRQQWMQAADDYSQVIKLRPNAWDAWRARTVAYVQANLWDKAIADLNKMLTHLD